MSNLMVRTAVGFAVLLMVLALAIFGSAGSFGIWQAWLYLAIFFACSAAITAYLMKCDRRLLASRLKAGPTAETRMTQKIIQSLTSLFFVGLFITAGLDFRFHWSAVPPVVSVISDGLVVLGYCIVFLAFRENSYASAIIEVSKEQKLIASGLYSVVRHPMYTGGIILLIFTPLALGSWAAVPIALLMILLIVVRLRDEERFLLENLSGYGEYRRKVRYRLVPFVW